SVFSEKLVSKSGMQMTLWRLQSQYLYYRKNSGLIKTLCSKNLEKIWNYIRYKKNIRKNPKKAEESKVVLELIEKAWKYTEGGKVSPQRPWKGE
ncbi:MAG: glycosyltransferase family 2 protein, partial [Patescibacteria group bacterium]